LPGHARRYTAQFLLSATAEAQFPAPSVAEVAFLGRSNVGKSSLLNALVGARPARVSKTPGRTRAINFFLIMDEDRRRRLMFADLPGYGYAKISKAISAEWPRFIEPYLAARETLALCVCLVDANVPPRASDRQLLEWLRAERREFVVAGTKIDRLSGNQRTRSLAALKEGLEVEEILAVSAKTGAGIGELWARIAEAGAKEKISGGQ
jgi:GTP-binding protein